MMYYTCQIKPTQFLKNMGYETKKFAIACEDDIDFFKVGMDLASIEGLSYIYMRKTKPSKEYTILSAKENYAKHLHL